MNKLLKRILFSRLWNTIREKKKKETGSANTQTSKEQNGYNDDFTFSHQKQNINPITESNKKDVLSDARYDAKKNSNIEWKDCILFVPPIEKGEVIKVYDGDTITIATRLPYDASPLYRFSVRLRGIDCPEIKGKTEEERTEAVKARDALEKLILHQEVVLKNLGMEKYGRILADVYFEEIHLNQWLLDNHYSVPYYGGKKS